MKQSVLVLATTIALFVAAPQISTAQDVPAGQEPSTRKAPSPDEVVDMLGDKLSLSDDQKAKIKPIIEGRQEKIRELAGDGGRRMRKARKMKSIFEESDKKINAVLNDDQKKKYAEIQKEMRERAKERMQERAGSNS